MAAQHGGADVMASVRGTLSGEVDSPLREVPTLIDALEAIISTDTAMSAKKPRERYTQKENARRMKA